MWKKMKKWERTCIVCVKFGNSKLSVFAIHSGNFIYFLPWNMSLPFLFREKEINEKKCLKLVLKIIAICATKFFKFEL